MEPDPPELAQNPLVGCSAHGCEYTRSTPAPRRHASADHGHRAPKSSDVSDGQTRLSAHAGQGQAPGFWLSDGRPRACCGTKWGANGNPSGKSDDQSERGLYDHHAFEQVPDIAYRYCRLLQHADGSATRKESAASFRSRSREESPPRNTSMEAVYTDSSLAATCRVTAEMYAV